jgi:hypothetical protein
MNGQEACDSSTQLWQVNPPEISRSAARPVKLGAMDKYEAGTGAGQDSVLEVRVELVDSVPGIWRRFELRGDPFAPLRPVDGEFPIVRQWLPGQDYEEPGDRPEEDCPLDQLLALGSGAAFYEYDFGDSWLHRLELVSRRAAGEDSPPARLIDGARRGPLEDSRDRPGYEAIMDALADPSHPDHAEHAAWVADITGPDAPFDPDFLDIPAVNRALADQF